MMRRDEALSLIALWSGLVGAGDVRRILVGTPLRLASWGLSSPGAPPETGTRFTLMINVLSSKMIVYMIMETDPF
jgi:hypothetical protein